MILQQTTVSQFERQRQRIKQRCLLATRTERACVTRQPSDRTPELVRASKPSQRNLFLEHTLHSRVLLNEFYQSTVPTSRSVTCNMRWDVLGLDESGADRVHPDVLRAELAGHTACHLQHPGLRRVVCNRGEMWLCNNRDLLMSPFVINTEK